MNKNKICVFDFETDGRDVKTLNPVQLAAVIVDPRKLELVNKAEFNSFIRPEGIDNKNYVDKNRATIEWHANIRGCSVDEILELWKSAPPQKIVWGNFIEFLSKFHKVGQRKTKFSAPIACGYNIHNFDLPIVAYSVGGLTESVGSYGKGLLVEPGDVTGFREAIIESFVGIKGKVEEFEEDSRPIELLEGWLKSVSESKE